MIEYLPIIGTVALIHLLAVVSPGPDFVVAIRNSLMYSRKTGIWTAVGFGLGISIHLLYCIAGIALLISQSLFIFNIIKFIGAGYLIYIGIKAFFSQSSDIKVEYETKTLEISSLEAVKIGFLTNVLNPKATLFFLSLFTLVISPETPGNVLAIMSLIMIGNTVLWFSLVSIFFTQIKVQNIFNKFQNIFNKLLGGALIALGIKVALTDL